MTTETLAPPRTIILPRVNLLPPEIAQERRQQRVTAVCAAVGLSSTVVVGLLYLQASSQVSTAEEQLAVVQADATRISQDVSAFDGVPAVYARVDAAQAQAEQALGGEVRWSFYLGDLAGALPKQVWFTKVEVASPDATVVPVGNTAVSTPGIATVVITGKGYAHNDVASWVDRLATVKGHADATFTSSVSASIGDEDIVAFDSNATITADRLSGRFISKVGD